MYALIHRAADRGMGNQRCRDGFSPPGPPVILWLWVSAFQFGFYRRFYWPTNMPTGASFAERRAMRVRIAREAQARAYSGGSGCAKVRGVASLADAAAAEAV